MKHKNLGRPVGSRVIDGKLVMPAEVLARGLKPTTPLVPRKPKPVAPAVAPVAFDAAKVPVVTVAAAAKPKQRTAAKRKKVTLNAARIAATVEAIEKLAKAGKAPINGGEGGELSEIFNLPLGSNGVDFSAMSVGQRVKWLRTTLLLTQDELTQRIGNSAQSMISSLERGSIQPSPTTIVRLANSMGVDPLWLAYGVGDMGLTRKNAAAAVSYVMQQAVRNGG